MELHLRVREVESFVDLMTGRQFTLHCYVRNAKLLENRLPDTFEKLKWCGVDSVNHMHSKTRFPTGNRPNVQVVKTYHTGDGSQGATQLFYIDVIGHTLEQNVDARFQERPGAWQYPYTNGDSNRRIYPGPAGVTDDQRAGNNTSGAQ